MTWASKIIAFYQQLDIQAPLPKGVEVLNPFADPDTLNYCRQFYQKYYDDEDSRTLIFGINPGRFGGGLTGIPFTDPKKLEEMCGIKNDLPKRAELSADFIHQMMLEFGGLTTFYQRFYFTSISPLGFTLEGKNLNYYDLKALQSAVEPFVLNCIRQQIDFGAKTSIAFCLGEGANFKYFHKLNEQHSFFDEIVPLPHPRFIMQYKRKQLTQYIAKYIAVLGRA